MKIPIGISKTIKIDEPIATPSFVLEELTVLISECWELIVHSPAVSLQLKLSSQRHECYDFEEAAFLCSEQSKKHLLSLSIQTKPS